VNVLSLYAGIGGLDLGLERAGMRVVGQVEIDPYCQRVLARHWPNVPRHADVHTAADWWLSEAGRRLDVDLVAGGFPCQPSSQAGLRLGPDDRRWLWPAMANVINAVQPSWVLWENVPGLLTRGLDIVHADLVRLGYRHRVGWASACAVGAPHARRRLFGVAHSAGEGRCPGGAERRCQSPPSGQPKDGFEFAGSGWWTVEPAVGRVAYGLPDRVDRCRALGNAVVPQVAEHIGRLIMAAHQNRR
jgi:DNA (cytosine-5)-methyltransferase 1